MEKKDVIEFFDRMASNWDADMIKSDEKIGKILDNAEVGEGMEVLDVACGTGVMFPYYLARKVASVTGIDISPEMAKIAAAKFDLRYPSAERAASWNALPAETATIWNLWRPCRYLRNRAACSLKCPAKPSMQAMRRPCRAIFANPAVLN